MVGSVGKIRRGGGIAPPIIATFTGGNNSGGGGSGRRDGNTINALSRAIDKGLRQQKKRQKILPTSTTVAVTSRQRRESSRPSSLPPITPSMRDYRVYCHMIQLSFGASAPEVTFPSFENDWKIYRMIERTDDKIADCQSFFNESFVRAIKSTFTLITFVGNNNLNKLKNQIVGHINGSGIYRKWSDWYQRSSDLGLFGDKKAPIVISLSLYPKNFKSSTAFAKFAKSTDLRPVLLNNVGAILFQNEQSSNDLRIDSLQVTDLKRLNAKSIYYKRIYIVHLMIYMVAYEALRCSSDGRYVVLVVEPTLRSLLELPTLWSVALHSEPDVDLYYAAV